MIRLLCLQVRLLEARSPPRQHQPARPGSRPALVVQGAQLSATAAALRTPEPALITTRNPIALAGVELTHPKKR